jgi:hypothetical protein
VNAAEKLLADVGRELQASGAGREMFRRMRQLVIDEMPTGTHRERARLWRKLAARCLHTADKHEAVADQREKTARVVRSFAPAFRQTALDAILRGELAVEMDPALSEGGSMPEGWAEIFPGESELRLLDSSTGLRVSPWGDPDNGTWRPVTALEREQGIRTRAGYRPVTTQEDRDNRTSAPPAWYFASESEIEES